MAAMEFEDITDRKAFAAEVQDSTARLKAVVDTAIDAIVVIDGTGKILSVNPATEVIFGYDPSELLGRNVAMLMPETHRKAHDTYLSGYAETGIRNIIGIGRELEGQHKDGSVFPIDLAVGEWHDHQGQVFYTGIIRDITKRKQTERQLVQAQKMEIVGQLTGGLAHDFNNMLAIIIMSLELAQKRLAKGATNIDALLDGALEGAQRAATLTARMMAFSRQQPLLPQSINLNHVIGGMTEMITRTIGDAIKVRSVLAGGLWTTLVDVSQMENALLNICVNARDAMPNGGSITIETCNAHLDDNYARQNIDVTAGQYVMIAVTDSGTGMTPEVSAKAFEPFFTTKDVGKGTGLGLSQVFGFIKQSGGHLKIYSEVGQGTTIKIYLPRSFSSASASQTATSELTVETQEMTRGDPSKIILVVDDERRVRAVTVATLRELGYTVIDAEDAVSGLKAIDENPDIGLLFTDIAMPGMNGRELAAEAAHRRSKMKVLFTTGFAHNAVLQGGALNVGKNFIAKPFTIEQLAAKVSQIMEG